jgi:hypothetical protein
VVGSALPIGDATTTRFASQPGPGRLQGPWQSQGRLVEEIGGGWWEVVTRFTLEVEGNEKPCFVGDSVTRVMAPAD